ncbi:MAG: hypothetical protein M1818_006266 [Claussenomyces sp. TS43310]|nr:MAG: hypothetical protein M1818_006266 [Claussenomyces sp. TS43310]
MLGHTRSRLFVQTPWPKYSLRYTTSNTVNELTYPDPPTANHHDLPSFLSYASRVGSDPKSTVFTGTHYEYTVQSALGMIGLETRRIGASNDRGIDLLGTWKVPSSPNYLKILVQCKVLSKVAGPVLARELEGAFGGAPTGWRDQGVLGILVTSTASSKGLRETILRSQWPISHVMCDSRGRLLQMLWNKKAEENGLQGMSVGQSYSREGERSIRLLWKGLNIMP